VLERGDRAVASERGHVPAGQLAGVERGGRDLALRDPDLDPPADEARIERSIFDPVTIETVTYRC
jgi:hypothetical protein